MPNLCDCKVTIRSQDFDTILAVAQVAKKHGPLSPYKVPLGDRLRERLQLVLAEMGFRAQHRTIPGPFLLDFLSPMPQELKLRAEHREGFAEAVAFEEFPDWWRWRIDNWGCEREPDGIDLEAPSPASSRCVW